MPTLIRFEPYFIEEAVFLRIKQIESLGQRESVRSFHDERTRVYTAVSVQDRERAFQDFHLRCFRDLGIEKIFLDVFQEFPLLGAHDLSVQIKSTFRKEREGAELFVNESSHLLAVSLRVSQILNPPGLQRFLRHELLHISDMVDPDFQYDPRPLLGGVGQVEEELIRGRFRVLWDLYVTSRLIHRGKEPFLPLADLQVQFEKAFSNLDSGERSAILKKLIDQKRTQADLIALAQNDRFNKTLGEGGLRCPLCHFTSYGDKRTWNHAQSPIINEIKKDFPRWNTTQGLCSQCFDLYSSRVGSLV